MGVKKHPLRPQQMPLNDIAVITTAWADFPLAVDHPLPRDIVPGRQRHHGEADGTRRTADLPGNAAIGGDPAGRNLADQGINAATLNSKKYDKQIGVQFSNYVVKSSLLTNCHLLKRITYMLDNEKQVFQPVTKENV